MSAALPIFSAVRVADNGETEIIRCVHGRSNQLRPVNYVVLLSRHLCRRLYSLARVVLHISTYLFGLDTVIRCRFSNTDLRSQWDPFLIRSFADVSPLVGEPRGGWVKSRANL